MIEVARITNPQGKGGENEEFWQSQRKKLLRNIVGLLLPVDGNVDLLRMNAIPTRRLMIQPRHARQTGAIRPRSLKRSREVEIRQSRGSRRIMNLTEALSRLRYLASNTAGVAIRCLI